MKSYTLSCQHCGQCYKAKRKHSKTCSTYCRVALSNARRYTTEYRYQECAPSASPPILVQPTGNLHNTLVNRKLELNTHSDNTTTPEDNTPDYYSNHYCDNTSASGNKAIIDDIQEKPPLYTSKEAFAFLSNIYQLTKSAPTAGTFILDLFSQRSKVEQMVKAFEQRFKCVFDRTFVAQASRLLPGRNVEAVYENYLDWAGNCHCTFDPTRRQ